MDDNKDPGVECSMTCKPFPTLETGLLASSTYGRLGLDDDDEEEEEEDSRENMR